MSNMKEDSKPDWVTASLDYLLLLEQPGRTGDAPALAASLRRLLEIGAATLLPETPEDQGPLPSSEGRYGHWYARASVRFPEFDGPAANHANGWFQNDVADIASELEVCLLLYDDSRLDEALWEWCFGFEWHWGSHHARNLLAHLSRPT